MAFDAFLKITGVVGDGPDGTIALESVGWNLVPPNSSVAGQPSGRADVQEIVITKVLDKASPTLFQSAASGQHFPGAMITLESRGGDRVKYLTIKLSDLLISSVAAQGNVRGGDLPSEQISFNFSKIEMTFTTQD